jgi:hypothetical protein
MSSRQFTQYILGLFFLVTTSYNFSNEGYTYNVIEDGIEITGFDEAGICQEGPMPEEIDGYTVSRIGNLAFFAKNGCSFILPSTITSVGEAAFFEAPTVMSLPESLLHIEEAAFYSSFWIFSGALYGELILPANIETIGKHSFGNNNLGEIHFLGNRPDIHQDAFIENNDIGTISYCSGASGWPGDPINGVTPIENSSCGNNTEFDYTIEYPTVSIDGCSFFCTGEIIIPENIDGMNVTKIASNAFLFSIIDSVKFPKTIEIMGGFNQSTASSLYFLGDRPSNLGEYFGDGHSLELVTYCPNTEGWPGYSINGITPELSEDCDNSSNQSEPTQYATFDIDQNGSVGALSDGLILLRYFFNLRGEALIANVIAEDATRTSAADIEVYIESHMP